MHMHMHVTCMVHAWYMHGQMQVEMQVEMPQEPHESSPHERKMQQYKVQLQMLHHQELQEVEAWTQDQAH